jgi:hypothetical protein
MITGNKIRIYKSFKGDIDSWVRMGSKQQLATMDDHDWALIDSLIQGLIIVKSGRASDDFRSSLMERIRENCDNSDTAAQLDKLADELG